MSVQLQGILERVVASIAGASPLLGGSGKSILSQAAASYGRKPAEEEATIPTGFDPRAAALFEAVVEAAFLVAKADGHFDDAEREVFSRVVFEACQSHVNENDIMALVADLDEQLVQDGLEQRLSMLAFIVQNNEQKTEVLRIAGLMAHVSGGVVEAERSTMLKLAAGFGMDERDVENALEFAASALAP